MSGVTDFLEIAKRDYKICLKVESDFPDEYAISGAAYHMQQAIEKLLRAMMLLYGVQPEFTHNIAKLVAKCRDHGITLPDAIEQVEDTLTLWESSSRYDPFISFSQHKYQTAKQIYNELVVQVENVIQKSFGEQDQQPKGPALNL
ncbi:MAG: HEPN domain-containing protein [Clostridia bacterium]|nr:HEPN domain-containing protein [Clostridia bacterium]